MHIQSLSPTIVNQEGFLTVRSDNSGRIIIKVLDVQGRIAKTYDATVNAGSQLLPMDMQDLPGGRYVLNAFCGDAFLKSIRFEKK